MSDFLGLPGSVSLHPLPNLPLSISGLLWVDTLLDIPAAPL